MITCPVAFTYHPSTNLQYIYYYIVKYNNLSACETLVKQLLVIEKQPPSVVDYTPKTLFHYSLSQHDIAYRTYNKTYKWLKLPLKR